MDNLYPGPDQDLVRAALQSEALLQSSLLPPLLHRRQTSITAQRLFPLTPAPPFIPASDVPGKSAPLVLLEDLS